MDSNSSSSWEMLLLYNSDCSKCWLPASGGREVIDTQLDVTCTLVHWTIVFVVTPSISVLGILGNSFSLAVISKQGLKKSSNVMLFCLALCDILFMLALSGPAKIMYEWGRGGFPYPERTARLMFYLYQVTDSINWTIGPMSLLIPVLVMVERLIAVFLPLRFNSLVTVRRTLMAITILLIVSVGLQIYIRTWFQFEYIFDTVRNVSVGMATKTHVFWSTRAAGRCVEVFYSSLSTLIIFVGCGCVAIGIKLKLVSRKRLTMTNNLVGQRSEQVSTSSTRTTKMLLVMCSFYTLACAPTLLSSVLPSFMLFPIFKEAPNFLSLGMFIYHLYKLAFCINASNNFLIYVATNRKFRHTFVTEVLCHKSKSRAQSASSVVQTSKVYSLEHGQLAQQSKNQNSSVQRAIKELNITYIRALKSRAQSTSPTVQKSEL